MNDVVLFHVVKAYEKLDGEPADQTRRHALEVVTLDELVQIHAQHFESKYQVFAKDELLLDSNYIFLVVGVVLAELFDDLGFDQALLVQPLFISQNFKSHDVLLHVVHALEHLPKRALAQPLNDFIPVSNVVALGGYVLVFVVVKTVIFHTIWGNVFNIFLLPVLNVKEINSLVV